MEDLFYSINLYSSPLSRSLSIPYSPSPTSRPQTPSSTSPIPFPDNNNPSNPDPRSPTLIPKRPSRPSTPHPNNLNNTHTLNNFNHAKKNSDYEVPYSPSNLIQSPLFHDQPFYPPTFSSPPTPYFNPLSSSSPLCYRNSSSPKSSPFPFPRSGFLDSLEHEGYREGGEEKEIEKEKEIDSPYRNSSEDAFTKKIEAFPPSSPPKKNHVELNRKLTDLSEKQKKLESTLQTTEKERAGLREERSILVDRAKVAEDRVIKLSKELEASKKKPDDNSKMQLEQLRNELLEREKQIETLRKKSIDYEGKVNILENDIKGMEVRHKQWQELTTSQNEFTKSERERELSAKLVELEKKIESKDALIIQLQDLSYSGSSASSVASTPTFSPAQTPTSSLQTNPIPIPSHSSSSTHAPIRASASEGSLLPDTTADKVTTLRWRISRGNRIVVHDKAGYLLTHRAVLEGKWDVFRDLINHGADLDQFDSRGEAPLHLAARIGGQDKTVTGVKEQGYKKISSVVEFLLKEKADPNLGREVDNATALHICAELGWGEGITLLIRGGAKVDSQSNNGQTPFRVAVDNSHFEVADLLIKYRALPNSQDLFGATPLLSTCRTNNINGLNFLLARGGSLTIPDKANMTPLMAAAKGGHLEAMKILIDNGVDVQGEVAQASPLHCAVIAGKLEAAEFLIACGANVSSRDQKGYTPLHEACRNVDLQMVSALVKHNADHNAISNDGKTPLDLTTSSDAPRNEKDAAEITILLLK